MAIAFSAASIARLSPRCLAGAHHRLAHLAHHRTDVGEIEVDEAGHDHQVGDAADALLEHLIGHLERFLEGRVRIGDQEQVLVGNDDQRIDMLLQLFDAGIGRLHAAIALEAEGLGDDADSQDAPVTRGLGDNGCGARSGAATHAGGDEAHVRTLKRLFDHLHGLFGGSASYFGTAARTQTLGDLQAKLDAAFGGGGVERLGVGIGDDEVDPLHIGGDHVGDRVSARAAYANHADAGLQLVDLRTHELDRHKIYSPAAAAAEAHYKLNLALTDSPNHAKS